MSLEEIKEVLAETSQGVKANEIEWTLTENTRHEINWATKDVIIDRRNNIDEKSQEICLKVGDYKGAFLPETDEFNFLLEFQNNI